MKQTLSNLATGLLVACAVVVTGIVVKREFFETAVAAPAAPRS